MQKLGTPPPRTPRIEMPVKDASSRDMIGSKEDMQQQISALREELSTLKQKLSASEEQVSTQTRATQASNWYLMTSFITGKQVAASVALLTFHTVVLDEST